MSLNTPRLVTIAAAVLALLAGLMATVPTTAAQDATPADAGAESGQLPHLAHINQGTCDELSHIVYKLDDVGAGTAELATPAANAVATPSSEGAVRSVDPLQSSTDVNASLDDLLAEPHVINIHESIEAVDTYIACGEITGTPADGELEIDLAEQNDSGIAGTATLTDNGDDTTTVVIELTTETSGTMATPEASPVS